MECCLSAAGLPAHRLHLPHPGARLTYRFTRAHGCMTCCLLAFGLPAHCFHQPPWAWLGRSILHCAPASECVIICYGLRGKKPLCPDGERAGAQCGESVFGGGAAYSAAALSTRAQLGLAAVTGALLATDYEAYRNHAWSDVKGKARAPSSAPEQCLLRGYLKRGCWPALCHSRTSRAASKACTQP